MGAKRLILIEGMIGAGKTTTARLVETWLTSRGEDARAFQELAEDHPIRTRAVDQLREHYRQLAEPAGPARDGGVADPGVYAAGQWRRLAERCRLGQQTVILESTFLQNSVMPAFIEGAPPETVREIFTTTEREAAAAEPLLIYLRPADIASAIARVHRERGEAWAAQNMAWVAARPWARSRNLGGREAVIRLYQAWEAVVDDLYGRYSFGKLMVADPQRDWDTALARIYAAVRP
jgi:predicted kinase